MATKPWDSTRCMRLLRPLKAHLAALEKEQQRLADLKAATVPARAPAVKAKSSADSPWTSRFAPKAITGKRKKTYTTKPRKPQSSEPVDLNAQSIHGAASGELQIPEAFILHRTNDDASTTVQPDDMPGEENAEAQPVRSRRSRQLRAFDGVRSEDNLGGLEASYLAILSATQPVRPPKRFTQGIGASSLRMMAIRGTARLIDEDDLDQQSISADHRTDTAEEIYTELDEIDLQSENGQPIQAQLVRAQATKLICDSIRGSLINHRFAQRLIKKMGYEMCETREVMAAIGYGICPDTSHKNCLRESMVHGLSSLLARGHELTLYQKQTGSAVAQDMLPKDILRHIIENQTFPVDWLSLNCFATQWRRIILDITSNTSQYFDSRRFVSDTFELACGVREMRVEQEWSLQHVPSLALQDLPGPNKDCDNCNHRFVPHQKKLRDAFTNSISSLLTILTSLVIVGSEKYTNFSTTTESTIAHNISLQNIGSIFHEISCTVLETNHVDWTDNRKHAPHYGTRSAHTLFCTLISQVIAPTHDQILGIKPAKIIQHMLDLDSSVAMEFDDDIGILDYLPKLLISISQASAQISGSLPEDILRLMINALMSVSGLRKRSTHFLQHICREAAAELEISYDIEDCSISLDEQEQYIPKTPATAKKQVSLAEDHGGVTGYKWEPMLADWVAATPAPRLQSQPIFKKPTIIARAQQCRRVFEVVVPVFQDDAIVQATEPCVKSDMISQHGSTRDHLERKRAKAGHASKSASERLSVVEVCTRRFQAVEIPLKRPKYSQPVKRISDMILSSSPMSNQNDVDYALPNHEVLLKHQRKALLSSRGRSNTSNELSHKLKSLVSRQPPQRKRDSLDIDMDWEAKPSSPARWSDKENETSSLRRTKRPRPIDMDHEKSRENRRNGREARRATQLARRSANW